MMNNNIIEAICTLFAVSFLFVIGVRIRDYLHHRKTIASNSLIEVSVRGWDLK